MDSLSRVRDSIGNDVKVEVKGKKQILIENHRGIISLKDDLVKIRTKIGNLNIYGSKFNLLFMEGSTIVIEGDFVGLDYEECI